MKQPADSPSGTSSLTQGLALLDEVVWRERSGRSAFIASRIADRTGIERSRASRLLQELTDLEYLERGEQAAFAAGPAYFALGRSLQAPWLRAARVELRRIASAFPAGVRVSAAVGGGFAALLRYESGPGAPESAISPGMVTPVWCTGAGRALLWRIGRDELDALLAHTEFVGVGGPAAARSTDEVWALMERDRAEGHVRAAEEFEYGLVEVGVPLVAGDRVVAALSAVCRAEFPSEALVGELEDAARRLEAHLQ